MRNSFLTGFTDELVKTAAGQMAAAVRWMNKRADSARRIARPSLAPLSARRAPTAGPSPLATPPPRGKSPARPSATPPPPRRAVTVAEAKDATSLLPPPPPVSKPRTLPQDLE